MARKPRCNIVGVPQHVIQRGNNREACFYSEEDYRFYLECLEESAKKFNCLIHAFVLMTNHVHILVTPQQEYAISQMMQSLGRKYVRYINSVYKRSGTLWEGRFKSSLVDTQNYFLICMRYIELNPVRAGMTEVPGEYKWSSYQTNGYGKEDSCLTNHPVYLDLGDAKELRLHAYRALFSNALGYEQLHEIREALNQEMVLGKRFFKEQVEMMTQRQNLPGQPGRPKVREVNGNYFVY